ncbi:M1 family metallopeptidase [Streptomyces griseorubiginosus]|uniref:Aminopeptidase N n=1 Tax=Streptomyces griseorubiginosus TaxID=67304 RepID=A0AAI8L015_9ACTN|nr:M1 family metallopeptidase [Streptomyces griseorubiginosus]AYC40374.1 Aminopeptidase N [Streptomyces griseorubiginosus]
MPRSAPYAPLAHLTPLPARSPLALFLAVVLTTCLLTGCDGGVHGTPGGSGLRDPYFPKAGNGGYDVSHYDLDLAYDPHTEHLSGTATLTARATQDLTAFDLDLDGLDVEKVTVDGDGARWNRAGQELTVRPHHDLDEGRAFRVTVRYSGTPKTITDPDGSEEGWLPNDDGAVALGEPTGSMAWFPGNNHPSDKASYDLTITVPEGLQAVSNGELTAQRTADGRTTSTWHTAEPMASYLATLAIGHYDIQRSTTPSGLPLYTAVDRTEVAASRKVLARIPEVLRWEEDTFGPYPFSSAGVIVGPRGSAGYALETQNRPFFPGPPDTATLVHELAHQWYGDSVSPRSWQDMWLNEGFATYGEWLWEEKHGGRSAQQIFDEVYARGADDDVWAFPPAKPSSAAHISDSPVYVRGAMVLHLIRRTVGDTVFARILRGWATVHRHGTADTADFTAYVEKQAPDKDFTSIWDDWLYGEGKPPKPGS